MMEVYIQKAIRRKLDEVQLKESLLTSAELKALRAEVIAEQNGETVLDGVLSNPEILYRNIGRCDR